MKQSLETFISLKLQERLDFYKHICKESWFPTDPDEKVHAKILRYHPKKVRKSFHDNFKFELISDVSKVIGSLIAVSGKDSKCETITERLIEGMDRFFTLEVMPVIDRVEVEKAEKRLNQALKALKKATEEDSHLYPSELFNSFKNSIREAEKVLRTSEESSKEHKEWRGKSILIGDIEGVLLLEKLFQELLSAVSENDLASLDLVSDFCVAANSGEKDGIKVKYSYFYVRHITELLGLSYKQDSIRNICRDEKDLQIRPNVYVGVDTFHVDAMNAMISGTTIIKDGQRVEIPNEKFTDGRVEVKHNLPFFHL
jgi:hypothetical protein